MTREAPGDCFMLALENISRLLMVEVFDIQIHHLGIFALMFSMADGTIFRFIPVISSVGGYARGNLLMTGQALFGDGFQVVVMTLAAVFKSRGIFMDSAQRSWSIIDSILLIGPHKNHAHQQQE